MTYTGICYNLKSLISQMAQGTRHPFSEAENKHSGQFSYVCAPICRMLLFSITLGLIFANMSPKVVFKSYMPQLGALDVTV